MTIKEIARLADVSITTVSKVMNNKDESISPETRERVLQVAKKFNYTPYSGVMSGPSKTFLLGVVLCSSNAGRMLEGILDEAQTQDYLVTTAQIYEDAKLEEKVISSLCKHKVDALLWQPLSEESLRHTKRLRSHNIPFLLLPSHSVSGTCDIDFTRIARKAAEALIDLEHKNIAFVSSSDLPGGKAFLTGYKQALFNADVPFQEQLVFQKTDDLMLAKISSGAISSVITADRSDAVALYEILTRRHYQIPRDLSLITLSDDSADDTLPSPIACIKIPYYDFGRHMAKNLINLLEQETEPSPFQTDCCLERKTALHAPLACQKKHMTVIGSINIDNYLIVNKLPITGMTSLASDFSLHPGGKAINVAVGVSRLGVDASVIGAIGNDLDADLIFSSLDDHSIAYDSVLRCPEASTGRAFIFVQPDGNSTISILSGANNLLDADDVWRNKHAFKNCSCCLMQTEVPQAALIEAARISRENNIPTILKPSACTYLEPELLQYIDIIVPNWDELVTLSNGKNPEEQTEEFLNAGVSTVIITLGSEGCLLRTRDRRQHFPAMEFTSVDNTGAGDAFISALAVYLQSGYSLENAIRIANYAAGFCITREGVALSMIDKNSLESHIHKKEPGLLRV